MLSRIGSGRESLSQANLKSSSPLLPTNCLNQVHFHLRELQNTFINSHIYQSLSSTEASLIQQQSNQEGQSNTYEKKSRNPPVNASHYNLYEEERKSCISFRLSNIKTRLIKHRAGQNEGTLQEEQERHDLESSNTLMVRREAFLQAKQLPDLTDFIRFQMSSTLKLFPNQ